MSDAHPEPEIIPPGQRARHGRGHDAGDASFDALGEKAEDLLRHPMTAPRAAYLLYALSIITGVPMLVGLIVAYVARSSAPEWQRSHFEFLIRTFWYFVVLVIVGALLAVFLVGFVILWVLPLWLGIRVIRGWMWLENKERVPNPQSWLFG